MRSKSRITWLAALLVFPVLSIAEPAIENKSLAKAKPTIEELGKGRYRIGEIVIDQTAGRFRLPGKLIRTEPPLEFLAVVQNGLKAYESLLELNADAFEFNLACILIGLDEKKARPPEYHFSTEPAQGDAVNIWISWSGQGKQRREAAASVLLDHGKPVDNHDWVYTASGFMPNGDYLAAMDGTLIGFAHDPASIIEHRDGLGLGDYGAIGGNDKRLPAVGAKIMLTVERRKTD